LCGRDRLLQFCRVLSYRKGKLWGKRFLCVVWEIVGAIVSMFNFFVKYFCKRKGGCWSSNFSQRVSCWVLMLFSYIIHFKVKWKLNMK
jgi:hypothetical protein